MEDSEAAALFVKHHVLKAMLCCAGIPRQMPFFDLSRRRTMAGDLVSVQRSHGGYIYADRFVLEADLSEIMPSSTGLFTASVTFDTPLIFG